MTSTCGGEWISNVLMREWWAGFWDGAIMGFMFVTLVCAVIVWRALDEVGE